MPKRINLAQALWLWAVISTAVIQVGVTVWLGVLAGQWLDRHFNTGSLFFALGIGLGLAVGLLSAWQMIHRAFAKLKQWTDETD